LTCSITKIIIIIIKDFVLMNNRRKRREETGGNGGIIKAELAFMDNCSCSNNNHNKS
jgi:hypothetical protein